MTIQLDDLATKSDEEINSIITKARMNLQNSIIEDKRKKLIHSLIDYIISIDSHSADLLTKEDIDKCKIDLSNVLKNYEKEILNFKMNEKKTSINDDDEIIKEFLENIFS